MPKSSQDDRADALPATLYLHTERGFEPTPLTRGPWDPRAQHGGPPAALLMRAARHDDAGEPFDVARLTVDLIRPIPMEPLTTEVEVVRAGRNVHWLRLILRAAGEPVAHATAVRMRRRALTLHAPRSPAPSPPAADGVPFEFPFFRDEVAYHRAVAIDWIEGRWGAGPCAVWMRLARPLVAGEPTSPDELLMTVVDAANGVCPVLDIERYVFINPELSVHLLRAPVGARIGMRCRSLAHPGGLGVVHTELFDDDGHLGFASQSLMLAERTS